MYNRFVYYQETKVGNRKGGKMYVEDRKSPSAMAYAEFRRNGKVVDIPSLRRFK